MARFFLSAAALVAIFVAASASPMRRMQVSIVHASVQGWLTTRVRQGMEGRGGLGDRLAGESRVSRDGSGAVDRPLRLAASVDRTHSAVVPSTTHNSLNQFSPTHTPSFRQATTGANALNAAAGASKFLPYIPLDTNV
jgi:hypothetical protein